MKYASSSSGPVSIASSSANSFTEPFVPAGASSATSSQSLLHQRTVSQPGRNFGPVRNHGRSQSLLHQRTVSQVGIISVITPNNKKSQSLLHQRTVSQGSF